MTNLTTYGFREFGMTVEVVPSIPKPPEKQEANCTPKPTYNEGVNQK